MQKQLGLDARHQVRVLLEVGAGVVPALADAFTIDGKPGAALLNDVQVRGEIVDLASDLNIIQKSGAWFSVDGERIGQGRDNARTYLEQHPDLMARIEAKLLLHHGICTGGMVTPNVNAPGSPSSEASKPTG